MNIKNRDNNILFLGTNELLVAERQQVAKPLSKSANVFVLLSLSFHFPRMADKKYPHKLCKLNDKKGDLTQRWYVEFWAWDKLEGKLKRRRLFKVNKGKTVAERHQIARKQMKDIDASLQRGGYFDPEKDKRNKAAQETGLEFHNITQALTKILSIKSGQIRARSIGNYKNSVNLFLEFLKGRGQAKIRADLISREHIISFRDWLKETRTGRDGGQLLNKSLNLHVGFLQTLFSDMVERKYIVENPAKRIKKLKENITARNFAYSSEQIQDLKNFMKYNDLQLWHFVNFVYYCYIRPNELRQLKIEHVLLSKNQIYIPAEIAKNHKDAFLDMPRGLRAIVESMHLDQYAQTDFIFTTERTPGSVPTGRNHFSLRHLKVRKALGFSSVYTLYSWKHTGVVQAYQSGVGIKAIQMQCRHHSLEETDKYLKSLGMTINKEFTDKFTDII